MLMTLIRTVIVEQKLGDYQSAIDDWHNFVDEAKAFYDVDMNTLSTKQKLSVEERSLSKVAKILSPSFCIFR
jgi:methyl coenzyme M reductase gamma subunit